MRSNAERPKMLHSICKRMAIEMGLVQAISERGGTAVSAKELSEGTRFDPRVIGRSVKAGLGYTTYSCAFQSVFFDSLQTSTSSRKQERTSSKRRK